MRRADEGGMIPVTACVCVEWAPIFKYSNISL